MTKPKFRKRDELQNQIPEQANRILSRRFKRRKWKRGSGQHKRNTVCFHCRKPRTGKICHSCGRELSSIPFEVPPARSTYRWNFIYRQCLQNRRANEERRFNRIQKRLRR